MFINIPTTGESLWDQLIYRYEIDEPSDFELRVVDEVRGEVKCVKKFYNTTFANINIAPILRYDLQPSPIARPTGLYAADDGFAMVHVESDACSSESRVFVMQREFTYSGTMLTTLPKDRVMSYGELDNLRFYVDENEPILVSVVSSGSSFGEQTSGYSISGRHGGVVDLAINSGDVPSDVEQVQVSVECMGGFAATVNYTIIDPYITSEGCRLAWISSAGSIEHYTFPIIKDVVRERNGDVVMTLVSAYSSEKQIDALSEIVCSTRVWKVVDQEYQRVEIASEAVPTRECGSLTCVELKMRYHG